MLLAAVDPGITPNADFPFLESLKQIGGGILVGAFIVIAIVAIIGAAMLFTSPAYSVRPLEPSCTLSPTWTSSQLEAPSQFVFEVKVLTSESV